MTVILATTNTDRRVSDETAAHFDLRYGAFIDGARLLEVLRYDIARKREQAAAKRTDNAG